MISPSPESEHSSLTEIDGEPAPAKPNGARPHAAVKHAPWPPGAFTGAIFGAPCATEHHTSGQSGRPYVRAVAAAAPPPEAAGARTTTRSSLSPDVRQASAYEPSAPPSSLSVGALQKHGQGPASSTLGRNTRRVVSQASMQVSWQATIRRFGREVASSEHDEGRSLCAPPCRRGRCASGRTPAPCPPAARRSSCRLTRRSRGSAE